MQRMEKDDVEEWCEVVVGCRPERLVNALMRLLLFQHYYIFFFPFNLIIVIDAGNEKNGKVFPWREYGLEQWKNKNNNAIA